MTKLERIAAFRTAVDMANFAINQAINAADGPGFAADIRAELHDASIKVSNARRLLNSDLKCG